MSGELCDGDSPDTILCRRCGAPVVGYAMIGPERYCDAPQRRCYRIAARQIDGTLPTAALRTLPEEEIGELAWHLDVISADMGPYP